VDYWIVDTVLYQGKQKYILNLALCFWWEYSVIYLWTYCCNFVINMQRRNTYCARNMKILVLALISISINFDKTLGQSWRKNDRIETFRTRQIIHNQFVCDDRDTTFELVTGKLKLLYIFHSIFLIHVKWSNM
jgi:hypothetical protein